MRRAPPVLIADAYPFSHASDHSCAANIEIIQQLYDWGISLSKMVRVVCSGANHTEDLQLMASSCDARRKQRNG